MSVFENTWIKRGVVVLVGLFVLALQQYAKTGALDPQALAGELANQLDKLMVGGAFGWLLAGQPSFMRPPERAPAARPLQGGQ